MNKLWSVEVWNGLAYGDDEIQDILVVSTSEPEAKEKAVEKAIKQNIFGYGKPVARTTVKIDELDGYSIYVTEN